MLATFDMPDELYAAAESKAAREGVPVIDLITRALRQTLDEPLVERGEQITFPLLHSVKPAALIADEVRAAEEATSMWEDVAGAGNT
jgi:hypothetical protein